MLLKIERWGEDLAIRLPADLAQRANLQQGDLLAVTVDAAGTLEINQDAEHNRQVVLAMIDEIHASFPVTSSVMDLVRKEE